MLCPSVCPSVCPSAIPSILRAQPHQQSQSQSQSQTPVGVGVVAVCARSYVDVQTFAKCQTKDQRHNRGSNNNNRRRHGKSNNNNRMFGGAINEIPAFDRAEAQSGSQRGSQTKCKESKSYMYVHAIHICIQMPCRHTYIPYTHVAPTDKAINY